MRLITFECDFPFCSGSVSVTQHGGSNFTDELLEDEGPSDGGTESQPLVDANKASGAQDGSSVGKNVNPDKSQGWGSKGISTAVNTAENGTKKTLG